MFIKSAFPPGYKPEPIRTPLDAREALKSFINDPLYSELIKAKNNDEFIKAKNTVINIRGFTSYNTFIDLLKLAKSKKEEDLIK